MRQSDRGHLPVGIQRRLLTTTSSFDGSSIAELPLEHLSSTSFCPVFTAGRRLASSATDETSIRRRKIASAMRLSSPPASYTKFTGCAAAIFIFKFTMRSIFSAGASRGFSQSVARYFSTSSPSARLTGKTSGESCSLPDSRTGLCGRTSRRRGIPMSVITYTRSGRRSMFPSFPLSYVGRSETPNQAMQRTAGRFAFSSYGSYSLDALLGSSDFRIDQTSRFSDKMPT